jgi:hypothetical protein
MHQRGQRFDLASHIADVEEVKVNTVLIRAKAAGENVGGDWERSTDNGGWSRARREASSLRRRTRRLQERKFQPEANVRVLANNICSWEVVGEWPVARQACVHVERGREA